MFAVWTTDDHRDIPLGAMETGHIVNCIRVIGQGRIRRPGCNGFSNAEWLLIFKTELAKRWRVK